MASRIRDDIAAMRARDPAARSSLEVVLCYPGLHAVWLHRIHHWLWNHRLRLLARVLAHGVRAATGVEIHPGARLGRRVTIDHGMGVVIGETAEIGDNVTIYHGVTLGGTTWKKVKRHPTIGSNVVIGTGAKVLGPVKVGDNTKIGANSVVVTEVPSNSIVVGIPGKVVFRVEGEKRIQMDTGFMPDPQSRAIASLLERVRVIEEKIMKDEAQGTKDEIGDTKDEARGTREINRLSE